MARILGGPNYNIDKQNGATTNGLSTNDILKSNGDFGYYGSIWYVLPIYHAPYRTGGLPYADFIWTDPSSDDGLNAYAELDSNTTNAYVDYTEKGTPGGALSNIAYAIAMVSQSGVELGIDFTSFSNFVHFGSATERVSHFKDKIDSIHYHASQSAYIQQNVKASPEFQSSSIEDHQQETVNLLREFDPYDRYLYFGTTEYSWPRDSNSKHYPSTHPTADTWYSNKLAEAEEFDLLNVNRLISSLPDYIKEDDTNSPGLVFVDMLGHYYDNLLIYSDAMSSKYDTDNRLNIGISRDLVGDALRGLGIELYQSQFNATDLSRLYIGQLMSVGNEQISKTITASDTVPSIKDQLDETYKKIYHNIPHLLQTKGTRRGLRALINAFGVPSNILEIREYGGIRKSGQNFGDNEYVTGSVDKIRLDSTGSLVSGSSLLGHTTTSDVEIKYTQDLHTIEVGWSPTDVKDKFIFKSSSTNFNIDEYIGDPRDRLKSTYADLLKESKRVLDGSSERTIYDFLRLLKYYDNQLFAMLKDFVPARTSLRKGAIIKPHLLERSKIVAGAMSQSFHQFEAEVDAYSVAGGASELWDDQDTTNTLSISSKEGTITQTISDQREKFNGELGGSVIEATSGELNRENTIKKTSPIELHYDTTRFEDLNSFKTSVISQGSMYLYYIDPQAVNPNSGGGSGNGLVNGGGSGGTVYYQTLDVDFLSNTNAFANDGRATVWLNGTVVANVTNLAAAISVYTTTTLESGDEVEMQINGSDSQLRGQSITVEVLSNGVAVATNTQLNNAITTYTYTVPTLSSQGTSATFNLRIT